MDSHLRFRLCVHDAGQLELHSDVGVDPRLVGLDLGLVWKKKHSTEVFLTVLLEKKHSTEVLILGARLRYTTTRNVPHCIIYIYTSPFLNTKEFIIATYSSRMNIGRKVTEALSC